MSLQRRFPSPPYDAIVVGGGPAGLAAAVYLGRARRTVVVFDCAWHGRSNWAQVNHNYLGFPDGIPIVELCSRGRGQAERFGARFVEARVDAVRRDGDLFAVSTGERTHHAHKVIFATGVEDRWAAFPGYDEYIGRSLHWCTVCDGYEMRDQRVIVIGNDDAAAEMAIQLTRHTERVTVLTNDSCCRISAKTGDELSGFGISVIEDRLAGARAKEPGLFSAVVLASGKEIAVDHVFSAQGALPNTSLVRDLGVQTNAQGYITVDTEAKTNVDGLFAAGDITGLFSHQVLSAAHEGATAAMAADHALFQRDRARRRACVDLRAPASSAQRLGSTGSPT